MHKVCDRCGARNEFGADVCTSCGRKRFAPAWVRDLRRITTNTSVQISTAHPDAESDDPRITLYKWWPGGRANFNINTAAQWEQIRHIIDNELGPILGWKSKRTVSKELKEIEADALGAQENVATLLHQQPELISRIVQAIDPSEIAEEDAPAIANSLAQIASLFATVDEKHREAITELVQNLPTQKAKAIGQLTELMESLTLSQITAVTNEVNRRMGLLNTFLDRALDEKTYEISGDNSIHRLLEQAMWIIDERYWLMHSNRQLRTVVGEELAKRHKKFEKQRPDFVCGNVDNKLIIIELKRPSHELTVSDLNQLEQYVVISRQYNSKLTSFEAILVGKKASPDLDDVLKVRRESFKVRTYAELGDDARRRYADYLKHLGSEA